MHSTIVKNPILRGFHPDPCIMKAENMYYIAVSSFEWLPGIRVYQSDDLVNWYHKTDLLTDQTDLRGNPVNGSIWAPHLSYNNGIFYLLYTEVKSTKRPFKDCHNYLTSAPSIDGPWATPVYINSSGFDPSLFHDIDGKKWISNEIWDYRMQTGNKSAGIVLQEYDWSKQKLIGPQYKIFDGTELAKTEAPHIYRHNDYYYLITAEGGTGKGHAVTVCRSRQVIGPYELDPAYPVLTAQDKPDSQLQCSGHGSIVQSPSGAWYMAYLCTRPLRGEAAILGRETALVEVCWTVEGWLALAGGGNFPLEYITVSTEKPVEQVKYTDFEDNFNEALKKEWNSLRILADDSWYDLSARKGYLRMYSGDSVQSLFEHHILAIRQKDFHFQATAKLDYHPETYNQMAGLLLYLNDSNYLYACITHAEEVGRVIRLLRCEKDVFTLFPHPISISDGEICIKAETKAEGTACTFSYRTDIHTEWIPVGEQQDILFLSGGFTGNFIGIGIHDMDRRGGSHADFDYFKYIGMDV